MKIAIISMIREPWGGSEELWAAMAAKALQQGHTIAHSTFRFSQVADKEKQLIEKGLLHIPRRGFVAPGTAVPIRWLKKAWYLLLNKIDNPFSRLLATKPDLVIYNGTAYSIEAEKDLLRILHKKQLPWCIIGHFSADNRREFGEREANILRQCYQQAKKVFFVSQRTLDTAIRQLATHIPNAMVVRNTVNLDNISLIPYPAQTEPLKLALVGNLLTIHKGQDLVLEILASDKWRNRNVHLNIYGTGPDEHYLKNLVAFYQLQHRVTFWGKVKDIRGLWADNHILLMPSHTEGMPLAVVEAMLCGRPCVVTDVGGHTEWVQEGREGFIAEAASVHSFGNAMERAWQQQDQWRQLGVQANQKALQLYGEDPAKTFSDVIQQLVKDRN
jgi:glycosyltransferase involved in cell wall biosynthesis